MFSKNLSELEASLHGVFTKIPDSNSILFFLHNSYQNIFENVLTISKEKELKKAIPLLENFVFRPGEDPEFDDRLDTILQGNTWQGNGVDFYRNFLTSYFTYLQKRAGTEMIFDENLPKRLEQLLFSVQDIRFTGIPSCDEYRTGILYVSKEIPFTREETQYIDLYTSAQKHILNLSIELEKKGKDHLTQTLLREPALFLLEEHIKQAYRTYQKENQATINVAYIDINNFKTINDKYGHRAGDYVLKEVARRIHSAVRNIDNVARFGGDEFVIVMPKGDHNQDEIKERINTAINRPISYKSNTILPECSIGISLYPDDLTQTDYLDDANRCTQELIDIADRRMYDDKVISRKK